MIDVPATRQHAPSAAPSAAPVTSDTVLQQFRVVLTAIKSHFQQMERQAGIGGAQVWALAVIRDNAGMGVGELAAALSVKQPTASNLVRSLGEQGYITHKRRAEDRRGVTLRITRAGRALLQRVSTPHEGVLPAALGELDRATLLRLHADLRVLITHLNADEAASLRPLASL